MNANDFMECIKVIVVWGGYCIIYTIITFTFLVTLFIAYCNLITNKRIEKIRIYTNAIKTLL